LRWNQRPNKEKAPAAGAGARLGVTGGTVTDRMLMDAGLWLPTLPPAPYLPFVAQTFQQLAQRAFLNPGGSRSVSDCHFLLSFPDSLKFAPSARCCDRFRFIGRCRTGKEQKTSEKDERSKVGHFIPLG
jgi:hypothetical protein